MKDKDPIRWDLKRKEQRDKDNALRDEKHRQSQALAILGKHYEQWKKRLLKNKKATNQDVIKALYDLMRICAAALKDKGLDDYLDFTIGVIEDKIGVAVRIDVNKKNMISQYVPTTSFIGPDSQVDTIAKHNATRTVPTMVFENQAQLEAVEFVKKIKDQEGFIGFVVHWPMLTAIFDTEEVVKVGVLTNFIGIGRYPSWNEYVDATVSWINQKGKEKAKQKQVPRNN